MSTKRSYILNKPKAESCRSNMHDLFYSIPSAKEI